MRYLRRPFVLIFTLLVALTQACTQPPQPGDVRRNPVDGLDYLWIPPGAFQMGCVRGDDECDEAEKPRHEVTITRGFWLGKSEVTVGAYERFVQAMQLWMPEAPDYDAGWLAKDGPMVQVTWYEAKAYCEWAGDRLPTEAEWEYASRGGRQGQLYPWGNTISREQAHYREDGGVGEPPGGEDPWENPSPVCSFAVTGWSLCDMGGNVAEWVADRNDADYYKRSPARDPKGPPSGEEGIARGGSRFGGSRFLRNSFRFPLGRDYRRRSIGFRCALEGIR